MQSHKRCLSLSLSLALLAAFALVAATQANSQANVIYSFSEASTDGFTPYSSLIADSAGNLYGTTTEGGEYEVGTVFELSPQADGSWVEQILLSFNGADGTNENLQSRLVLDSSGNLYGVATFGGAYNYGVAFELSPLTGGAWASTVLHTFNKDGDGIYPEGGLIFDARGNLYGVTGDGGAYGLGTAFVLRKNTNGSWAEEILHSFGNGTDGQNPNGPLTMDNLGHLYGTTYNGGAHSEGTVFALARQGNGSWQERILHAFSRSSSDGENPYAGVILASGIPGRLYGTTFNGGASGSGAVFEVARQTGGGWKETLIHSFSQAIDGAQSRAALTEVNGTLYGTTSLGGASDTGTVFGLAPGTGGTWTESFLYSFTESPGQSKFPYGGLLLYSDGNLYGTAQGGAYGVGSVYEIKP
jgi:uncharacterized repeat protein (TIGR03803 family)